jgi:hypothetical protein
MTEWSTERYACSFDAAPQPKITGAYTAVAEFRSRSEGALGGAAEAASKDIDTPVSGCRQ